MSSAVREHDTTGIHHRPAFPAALTAGATQPAAACWLLGEAGTAFDGVGGASS